MNVAQAIAHMLKREGVEYIIGYPVNPILEACAEVDIRPIIVRQERTGLHMADAISRTTSGQSIGVFAMQQGPGSENAFGGVAQAYGDSVPLVVLPAGYPRGKTNVDPNFSSLLNFQHITKWCEQVTLPELAPDAIRRAFTQARNGRPRPVLVEFPTDVLAAELPEGWDYHPAPHAISGPDPAAVREAAAMLLDAKHPLIYAGQGVHYARAWEQLRAFAEMLEAPVTTSLQGKSAFPENHPLSLGSGGRSYSGQLGAALKEADVIFGIGCSFTTTNYGLSLPRDKTYIHATLDALDLNKDLPIKLPLLGDARLTLEALMEELRNMGGLPRGRRAALEQQIAQRKAAWMQEWMPKLQSEETPLSPYRVLWDLAHTVERENTIITHDAGSPRDQISPFWEALTPLSYLGWGKTTQLGYGLGLAMGAKLAHPEKLCINVWGDAAIGFTGMDFETAARERIPIMSILLNNFSMAIELKVMPVSTEKYRSTDISGNYADFARALGCYGERVTEPGEIIPAIERGIAQTLQGNPVLLEFITSKELSISQP